MSMYSIFGTKIQPKFTNDSKNILKVSSKKEIFFDVFECQLNGKNIVVEKTGQYENTPIVKFEIKDDGNVFTCEALLVIDKENDLYLNENNLEFSKNIKVPIVEKTIVEKVKKIVPTDTLHEEKIQNISDKIVAESEEKAKLIQEAKLKEFELKQEQIIEQSENYLNGKFDNYIKENIHTLVTDSNLVYDKLVENLNNLNDGEIKDILGERIKSINEELNHQLKNEVTSMKKYVEMSSGGGGTNAKQYANGGKMNGDLEVTGKITAGTIAGATELNGGTIDGDLTVTGSISADTIIATTLLSANEVDFATETNSFTVSGDFRVGNSGDSATTTNTRLYGQTLQYGRVIAYDDILFDSGTFFLDSSENKVAFGTQSTSNMVGKVTIHGTDKSGGLSFSHTQAGTFADHVNMYYQGSDTGSPFLISREDTGGAEIVLFNTGDINFNGGYGGVTDSSSSTKTLDGVGIGVNASAVTGAKPQNKLHVYESLGSIYNNNQAYSDTPYTSNAQVQIQATDKTNNPTQSFGQSPQRRLYLGGDNIFANELTIGTHANGLSQNDQYWSHTILAANPINFRSRNNLALRVYDGKIEAIGSSNTNGAVTSEWVTTNFSNSDNHKEITSIQSRVKTTDSNAQDDSGGTLVFQTKPDGNYPAADRMIITSTGNVGIGTSNNTANGKLHVKNGSDHLLVVKTTGEVGIGTASPTSGKKLDVAGNIKASTVNLTNVPEFADDTAASSLATGDVYKTSTGQLMIKL